MTEAFLHYLWQYQYFDKRALGSTDNETIVILKTGFYNTNAGPDFLQATVRIGSLEWTGGVEIHIHASEWLAHKHHQDAAYDNVVLHVVWKNDKLALRSDGSAIPTLELRHRVDEKLLLNYRTLTNNPAAVPCAASLPAVSSILRTSTVAQAVVHRLEKKSRAVLQTYAQTNNDWEETLYRLLGQNFGFKVNAEPFLRLTESLPYKTLLKHRDYATQLEALLFGMAGMLEKPVDEYATHLAREYTLLKTKFALADRQLHVAHWRFLRLRPANFPTLRLAQFAALLAAHDALFSRVLAAERIDELKQLFTVVQSEYWQQHYQFGKPAAKPVPALGDMAVENIIINSVVPVLAAYSLQKDEVLWMDRALEFLDRLRPEQNQITRQWADLQWPALTAFDSQGLVELKNSFCNKRLCLQCTIGTTLIHSL